MITKSVKKPAAKKPAAKSTAKPAAKAKEMSPLEKARAAKAASGKRPVRRAAGKRTPPKKFFFKAPEGVKSFFIRAVAKFTIDGMLAPDSKLIVIKGKPDNPNAPKYDLTDLDPQTAIAFFARLSPVLYAANPARRMPPKTAYGIMLRCSVNKEGVIKVSVKTAGTVVDKKMKMFKDKTDPVYRRIRRTAKLLAGAFTRVPDMNELKLRQKELDARQDAAE